MKLLEKAKTEASACKGTTDEKLLWQLRKSRRLYKDGEDYFWLLVTSQTLKAVFEVEQSVLGLCSVRGGGRVAELGVRLVALRLADPGQSNFGGVVHYDVVAGAHVQRAEPVYEKL